MRKEKYLEIVALFLIVLVLTIPFYTTSVYASLNSIGVKGSDNINNYAKASDFLTFNAQASIANDTSITANQVQLGSGTQFNSCTAAGNASDCTLRFPASGNDSFELKSVPFTVRLFRDDNFLDDEKSGNITIDHIAPQVTLSTTQPVFTSLQAIVINYAVRDTACNDPTCAGKCSGLKRIELYTADKSFNRVIALTGNETTNCSQTSSINLSSSSFNNGMNSVFAKATDKLNQVSPETSVTFTIDAIGPSILQGSFAIVRKGISLSSFPSPGINAEVMVNISETNLNFSSVKADLSSLNPSQNLRNVAGLCALTQTADIINCRWPITLKPGTPGLKTVVINASDNIGNKESVAITKLLSLDDNGPVVQSLSTPTMINGQLTAGLGSTTVTAIFDEVAGISPDEVFLHFGSSRVAAAGCSKQGQWSCTWQNLNLGPIGTIDISIQSDSTDVLLNPVAQSSTAQVILDAQVPVLRSINITNIGSTNQAFPGFFKVGDKIAVVANLTEQNEVFAVADFSPFINGASSVAGSCERVQADERLCTWLTPNINLEANNLIRFNFTDSAGNTLTVTRSLKTYGLETAAAPDFWSNIVSCSPANIDRSLSPLINQRVYCQVSLQQKSSAQPASTVFIGPASCSGESSILQNVETFNTQPGSTTPVIKITLRKDDFKINKADLSCSFNIFSKIGSGSSITQNPEAEIAKINLGFINLPLGELSKEVQDKINDAKDEAKGIWELIGTLNKIMFYFKRICQIFGIIYNIIAILYTITVALKIYTDACITLPIIGPVCAVAFYKNSVGLCTKQQATRDLTQFQWQQAGQKFCKFVNCEWAPWILGEWQKFAKNQINKLPLANYVPGKDFTQYMKPQENLIVATAFACLPGIIYGLDKYRQIKCLYADCLQNAVGKEGIPVTACEDQKAYATCKYVTGEIFAIIPWTAFIDHILGLVKNVLSNPFTALGAGIAALCYFTCPAPPPTSTAAYTACETVKLFSTMGEVIGNVKSIIDEGFKIRTDYCARLENEDVKK